MSNLDTMESAKPWVDGPFELISSSVSGDSLDNPAKGARKLAAEMTVVHNALLRGLNAIYNQAVNVSNRGTAQDKQDFANFAHMWATMLNEHHELEETIVFPDINKMTDNAGLMDANVEEHAAFHDGLAQFSDYLQRVRTDAEEELDGVKLREIIDSFMPALARHLRNEIETLLKLVEYDDKCDWEDWFQNTVGKHAQDSMKSSQYRNEIFPLAIIFHDKTFEGGIWKDFPPIPWIFLLAMQWLFMRTHQSWWRFAGCDFNSNPKELPFV